MSLRRFLRQNGASTSSRPETQVTSGHLGGWQHVIQAVALRLHVILASVLVCLWSVSETLRKTEQRHSGCQRCCWILLDVVGCWWIDEVHVEALQNVCQRTKICPEFNASRTLFKFVSRWMALHQHPLLLVVGNRATQDIWDYHPAWDESKPWQSRNISDARVAPHGWSQVIAYLTTILDI